jgi:Polysaccharide lyase
MMTFDSRFRLISEHEIKPRVLQTVIGFISRSFSVLRPLFPRLSWIVLSLTTILMTLPAYAAISFLGDWADFGSQFEEAGPQTRLLDGIPVEWVAGSGANHWRIVQERGKDRLQVERDPTSPKGGAVLRVEVRSGDTVGWSGERAEVSHMLGPAGVRYPVTADTGHEVYGLSTKVDSDWHPPTSINKWRWGLILQLHGPDDFNAPPALALAVEDDFHINLCAGDLSEGGASRNKDANSVALSRGDLRRGHWVQFLIDVVWAYDSHGSLTVYRRDEGEATFTPVLSQAGIPTLQFRSTTPHPNGTHYWKAGYYRSVSPNVTSRLWLGPIVRGTSMQEVATAAFGRP